MMIVFKKFIETKTFCKKFTVLNYHNILRYTIRRKIQEFTIDLLSLKSSLENLS